MGDAQDDQQHEHRLTDGVSVGAIRAFLKDLKREFPESYADMTTEDACQQLVVPRTKERNCAYVELLRRDFPAKVGKATVFVSHAWRYKITDVLGTLLEFAAEKQEEEQGDRKQGGNQTFFWFDLFMNNQNANVTANLPQDWWSTTFKESIASIGHVLLVLMPWHDPVPLTRAWCLWEIFCGISNEGTEVNIRLPRNEEKVLEEAIIDDAYDAVTNALVRVDAQRAEARSPHDKAMIFKAIDASAGGFRAVNQTIKDQLRAWCLSKAIAAVEAMQQQGKQETAEFVHLCHQVGGVLAEFGDTEAAIEYYERALITHLTTNGEITENVIGLCSNLGLACKNKGEYDKATDYFEKGLALSVEVLGEQHPRTADMYNYLGVIHSSRGESDKAIEHCEKAREIRLEALGEKHVDMADTYNNLGIYYGETGQHEQAIQFHQRALAIRKGAFGDKHPSTGSSYSNLGILCDEIGEYDKAIEYHEKAREIHTQTLGEKHTDTADAHNNLGLAHMGKGEYDKAMDHHEKAREIRLEALGEEHPSTADTYSNLGLCCGGFGEHERAIQYHEKAHAILLKSVGESHPSTALAYSNLASVYDDLGKYDKAVELYKRSLAITGETLGEAHPAAADRYHNLGFAYGNNGEYDAAIECYKKSLAIRSSLGTEAHPTAADSLNNIGDALCKKGEYAEALTFCEAALAIQTEHLGHAHESTAITLCTMGQALEGTGDTNRAAECFQSALGVLVPACGTGRDHPAIQDAQSGLERVRDDGTSNRNLGMTTRVQDEGNETVVDGRHMDDASPRMQDTDWRRSNGAPLSGWLQKRKRNGRAFLPRWFALTADALVYSKTAAGHVRQRIPLATVESVKFSRDNTELHVSVLDRTFVLRVDTRSETTLAQWCAALKNQLTKRGN